MRNEPHAYANAEEAMKVAQKMCDRRYPDNEINPFQVASVNIPPSKDAPYGSTQWTIQKRDPETNTLRQAT